MSNMTRRRAILQFGAAAGGLAMGGAAPVIAAEPSDRSDGRRAKGRVLIVGTNTRTLELNGGRTYPTGNYLNEMMIPTLALLSAGYEVMMATPDGTKPWIDEGSRSAV